jgi:hypothetical protein
MRFISLCLLIYITLLTNPSNSRIIPDSEYEQVIADRYLFSPFSNESTWWPVLNQVESAWQVSSLPQYHNQSSQGVWLLIQNQNQLFQMCYMSLLGNGSLVPLPNIYVNSRGSFLVSSNNKNLMNNYTSALISPTDIQLILCNQFDATSCFAKRTIPFPSSIIKNTTKIFSALFIEDFGSVNWLYIGSDSGLHALNLNTFELICFVNGINVGVSSLAWDSRFQTIFIGTETKLWIETYFNGTNKWRFEHVNGLIDAPITSLVYNDLQEKLWIGHNAGITLLSPRLMTTGRQHWYFSRLAGQISNPGSDIGHLPFANITTLSIMNSNPSDGRVWLGSIYGLARFDPGSNDKNAWRVFNSGRYMPNRLSQVDISSVAVLNRMKNTSNDLGCSVVAITNRGLSVLRFEMWTLAKKAQHFQNLIDQSDSHVRYGFVSDCGMSKWGDPRTCVKGPNDNDGLWSSMYLASQVFRYVITNDSNVKQDAWKHFQALYFLNQITGYLLKYKSLVRRFIF